MSILQVALTGSKWADAQVNTIRMRLLKVGARVVETCRKVWLHLPTAFPNRDIWKLLQEQLC
ncbi:MAG: transposase [Armatimonadota bacterium]